MQFSRQRAMILLVHTMRDQVTTANPLLRFE